MSKRNGKDKANVLNTTEEVKKRQKEDCRVSGTQ